MQQNIYIKAFVENEYKLKNIFQSKQVAYFHDI